MTHVVFDIGNVLVRWDPYEAFRPHMADTEIAALFDEVDFPTWNLANDAGRTREEAVSVIVRHWPHHAETLDGYFERFSHTIRHRIDESWEIAERLKRLGRRIFALTNWGPSTWGHALDRHPGLTALFEDIVVSGHEGMVKPDARIFEMLCQRNGLKADECLFIDDSQTNVEGARNAGWDAIHFTTPRALETELNQRGLL